MNNKTVYATFVLLSFTMGLPCSVLAEDVSFTGRVVTGVGDYSLSIPGASAPIQGFLFPGAEFKVNAPTLGVGFSIAKGRFYGDLFYSKFFEQSDDLNFPQFGYREEFDGDRNELAFSVGYAITDNLSVYVGYKRGKTVVDGALGSSSRFKEDGYFIGASYGWVIAEKGVLALNLAIADLDGDIDYDGGPLPIVLDASSQARGLTYGISWRSQISGGLGYVISVDHYDYNFDDLRDKRFGELSGEIEEKMTTFRIGLTYEF